MPAPTMPAPEVCIVRLAALDDATRHRANLEAIFFATSATESFASEAVRAAFLERWLGRFLDGFPDFTFVALDREREAIGYVVGALEDPARDPRFTDIAYFAALRHLTPQFPAHLHINLAERARNRGVGRRLITAFCDDAWANGAPGVHVVTAKASRNRPFYARNGFELQATLGEPDGEIVMLGRRQQVGSTADFVTLSQARSP